MNKKFLFVLEKGKSLYYGAETSLKEYLNELSKNNNIEIHLLVRKSLFIKKEEIQKEINRFFNGIKIKKVYILPLPLVVKGMCDSKELEQNFSLKQNLADMLNNIVWTLCSRKKYMEILKYENYDIIHVNTFGLYKLVTDDKYNFYIHIRNIIEKTKIIDKIKNKLKGMIFIDNTTYIPFSKYNLGNKCLILNNPVNGREILEISKEKRKEILTKYNLKENNIILSLIGRISPVKEVLYIINKMNKIKDSNIKLLIIGDSNDLEYKEKCIKAVKNPNIIFTGPTSNIELFYSITDYVLRGDNIGIGRTHLEALFSGKKIIIPGNDSFIEKNDILLKYKEQIITYEVQKENKLFEIIEKLEKYNYLEPSSNTKEYVSKMLEFYEKTKNINTI